MPLHCAVNSGDILVSFGLAARKPVFGVSEEVIFKPACSASKTSYNIEILLVTSLDMILFKK